MRLPTKKRTLIWLKKQKGKLRGLLLLCTLITARLLCAFKWGLALVLVFALAAIVAAVRLRKTPFWAELAGALMLACLWRSLLYNYTDGRFHFWLIPSVLALLAGAGTALARRRAAPVIAALLITWVCSWTAMHHLNHILDLSPPQSYTGEITEKHYSPRRKAPDRYILVIDTEEGPQNLAVSRATYRQSAVGGTITYRLHNGAFHASYYKVD